MVEVSIIIPCFNAERYLGLTIESALNQTLSNFEIIIIDDGSTDGSVDIIRRYVANHAKIISAEFGPNQGVSVARNRGTQLAVGRYIQYLDSDDLLLPEALARRVKILDKTDADVTYSDWQKLIEQKDGSFQLGEIISQCLEDIHPDPEIALFTNFWTPPVGLLYRRSLIERMDGWNKSLPIIQDARFALDAAMYGGRFVHVPGVDSHYRVAREKSLSRRNEFEFVKDCYVNGCQVDAYWQDHGGLNNDRRSALSNLYDFTARTILQYDENMFKNNLTRLYQVNPGFEWSKPKISGLLLPLLGVRITRMIAGNLSKPWKK